jgi:anaerobic magnesium-protoporphyrin IX monomethyl ester cyclase
MSVLLTHGYFLFEDDKEQQIMKPYPPLGILYLSAYLEKFNVPNEIYDTTFSKRIEFKQYLLKTQPTVLAIYTNLMTKVNVLETIRFVKSTAALSKCKIVLGGPDITYNVPAYLNAGADFLIIGEGEESMLELTQGLLSKQQKFTHIDGIAFLNPKKEVQQTAARKRFKDVDELPWPNRKKIDVQRYLDTWKHFHGKSSLSVSTQRGCPYTCRWCSTAVYGQSYRRRSPKNVVDELETLYSTYQPDSIWFVDDVFTVSHKWLETFTEEIKNRKLKLHYECISRADRMNETVIQQLKASGCIRIWIGAESGSQKIIDAMDRRVDVAQVQEMIQLCKQHGMEAGTFIMLGYPGETQTDINDTILHLKNANPDQFTITVAYPIKGTGLFQEVETLQTTTPDWEYSTDRDRDFKRSYSRKYYDYAVRHVVNEVHFHKKRLQKKHISKAGLLFYVKSKLAKTAMEWERLKTGLV